ncbi:MAG: sensor histidine kinase [Solirubrobacteraceae bacterium]
MSSLPIPGGSVRRGAPALGRHPALDRWLALRIVGAVATPPALALGVITTLRVREAGAWVVPFAAMFLAGAIAQRRLPEHPVARRLLVLGTVGVLWVGFGDAIAVAHRELRTGWWLGVANELELVLDLTLPCAALALLAVYPDGRYQRGYERALVRVAAALTVAVPVLLLLSRPTLQPSLTLAWTQGYAGPYPTAASPVYVAALGWIAPLASGYARTVLAVVPAVGVVVLALRYRRFGARERLQIRWPLNAGLLVALQPLGNLLAAGGLLPQVAVDLPVVVALTALATALAVGLLRPLMFDVDRALRRSAIYVGLWVAVVAVYVGIAAVAGAAAGGGTLHIAAAVAIVGTLVFEPGRRGLARRAALWARGERLGSEELLRRLGAALEHTLEPRELAETLAETIREGLGVLWVRITLDGTAAALAAEPAGPGGRAVPADPAAVVPLAYGDERLGTIECGPCRRGLLDARDRDALATLGRQAALAMGNARLASELGERLNQVRAQAAELAASRARIVAAEERGRRQIERNIHDGIQQELVALIAQVGIARNKVGRDPALMDAALTDVQAEIRQALADLRELVGGIHPSVLGDRGIVEALEVRAARLPLGVTVECDRELRDARFPEALEGAAYFFACEALANALKHAAAQRVTIRLTRAGGELMIEIADDGCGFDPAHTPRAGLEGLADRIEALGGRLDVRSAPGTGTTVSARIPVKERALA